MKNFIKLNWLLFGLIVLIIVSMFYLAMRSMLSMPVKHVMIDGDFLYVDYDSLDKLMAPFLSKGFLLVNISAIRKKIESQAWVYRANVRRIWPSTITVRIAEQVPVARFDEHTFLNQYGHIFSSSMEVSGHHLSLLQGPNEKRSDIVKSYHYFGEQLRQQGLVISRLSIDNSGNVVVVLTNNLLESPSLGKGVTVVLGKDQVQQTFQRFVSAYRLALAPQFGQIDRIDMRYRNGLAISFIGAS